jgi:hypothetical protein
MRIHLPAVVGLLFGFFTACVSHTVADDRGGEGQRAARDLVQEALQREAYGLATERYELLRAAMKADPEMALPRWYLGQVRSASGIWGNAGRTPDPATGQLYREYRALRDTKADDAQGHKSLADWCASHGMKQQERAHLLRSLVFNPNQAELRQRLGLVKVGQQWFEPTAVAKMRERQQSLRDATEKWQPIFTRLAPVLSSPNAAKREAAKAEILAVKDPLALPALQSMVGVRSEEDQELVLRVCKSMGDPLATELLAWQAAESPSPRLRRIAAEMIEPRDESDYVPLLIAEMYSPVQTKVEMARNGAGAIFLRRSFWREGADQHEVFVSDASFNPTPALSRGAVQRIGLEATIQANEDRARRAAATATVASDLAVAEQNRLTQDRNTRIAAALMIATGQKFGALPDAWWQWWMETNELTLPNGKGLATYHQTNHLNVAGVAAPRLPPVTDWSKLPASARSCLAAGTPISTDQGFVAVEKLNVGDLVLSRDIETGELSYKPVLMPTIRPKKQLWRITAGKDVFEATGGHLFWVSGLGWVRTRELKPGQVLHAAGQPVTVVDVRDGLVSETYNLVVADFGTYFVGREQILSHDNTPRRPTSVTVPGLKPE